MQISDGFKLIPHLRWPTESFLVWKWTPCFTHWWIFFSQLEAIFMLVLPNKTKTTSNFPSFAKFEKHIDDSFWTKCNNLWPPLPCLHVTGMSIHWLWMSPYHRFMSMCEWESKMDRFIYLIHGMQNILHKLTHTLLTKTGPTNSCFSPDFFILR